jgi:recombination protein RecA
VKNKVAPPFREAEFDIMFRGEDVGISREGDLIDLGVLHNVVDKSGTWFSYGAERLGQGKENSRMFLKEHPEMAAQIEREVRKLLDIEVSDDGPGSPTPPAAGPTDSGPVDSADKEKPDKEKSGKEKVGRQKAAA